jgi:hypothetical protein
MEADMPRRVIYLIASDSMPGLVKLGLTEAGIDDKKTAIDDQVLPAGFQCVFAGIISCHSRVLGLFNECFGRYRPDGRQFLYGITVGQAVALLSLLVDKEIRPSELMLNGAEGASSGCEETEIDLDGDHQLLAGLLDGSLVDVVGNPSELEHSRDVELDLMWSAHVRKWMKEDECRCLRDEDSDSGRDWYGESGSLDPYLEDAREREFEERAGFFRHEAMGDRSTDDLDSSDPEYYESLVWDQEARAEFAQEQLIEDEYADAYQARCVDADGFEDNPDWPSGGDECYPWEAEDYEEQKSQLSNQ